MCTEVSKDSDEGRWESLIRQVSLWDLFALRALRNRADVRLWLGDTSAVSRLAHMNWFVRRHWRRSDVMYCVSVPGLGLAGVAALYEIDPVRKSAVFGRLMLSPEFRGTGLARALLHQCISKALNLDLDTIELTVREDNAPAIALYSKVGFLSSTSDAGFISMRLSLCTSCAQAHATTPLESSEPPPVLKVDPARGGSRSGPRPMRSASP